MRVQTRQEEKWPEGCVCCSPSSWRRAARLPAQQLPPGYVDPGPVLAAASKAINEQSLRCITFSGAGYSGPVGQTFENAVNIDWQRSEMANYTRTINWETGTSKETFDRKPGNNPASWKYGLGWVGGTPTQANLRQTHIVNGRYAWHIDGTGAPVAVPPEMADVYQLDVWLNPHGFLKAARMPGANPKALWRWEQIEKGRDGNVVDSRARACRRDYGAREVSRRRDDQQSEHHHAAQGDGERERARRFQHRAGVDRVRRRPGRRGGRSTGTRIRDGTTTGSSPRRAPATTHTAANFPTVQANACDDPVPVPESVKQAQPPNPALVTVEKMADGVYLLGGGPANSYMVEFRDFVAVFEAPGSEERSLAVIEQIAKLAPNKPIRWLISSHPHFDHIGGLRTYNHIGATVVTHMINLKFLNRDVLTYKARTVKPDILSLWPPTEVAEGYNYEAIQENYVITDNSRILRVYYVQPLQHVAGMLMAYLPAERIAFEADLFDTHEAPKPAQIPAMRSFYNQVQRMKLDVATVAPVHGKPVPWSTFMTALGPAAKTN